ncbi:MAG: rhomboid family intramembrane serine protease [Coriobacteriales bacterium]|nr:rhomboid family intramembrane serine protease [Coriobacteriales bacterium]
MYGDTPPKRKGLRISFNAPVTLIFAALCVGATAAGVATGGAMTRLLFSTYRSSLFDPLMYLRLFTHAIGHMGWDHLVGNMTLILLLGPLLEEKYGSSTLAEVILITAGTTGVLNNLLFPSVALCGASGVCFAFILLSSITSLREGEIPLTFILVAVLFLGQQVVDGLFAHDNISQFGHIVGGIVGASLGFALSGKKR